MCNYRPSSVSLILFQSHLTKRNEKRTTSPGVYILLLIAQPTAPWSPLKLCVKSGIQTHTYHKIDAMWSTSSDFIDIISVHPVTEHTVAISITSGQLHWL